MTKPLLAILLLLPMFVSAGELDGKGIICQRGELLGSSGYDGYVIKGVFGVEFRDRTAVVTRVVPNSPRASIVENAGLPYESYPRVVVWGKNFYLKRDTLVLEWRLQGEVYAASQCRVEESLANYKQVLERLRLQMQAPIDEATKDNKI